MRDLQTQYATLRGRSVRSQRDFGILSDVLFELTTLDTFIAGCADTLIGGGRVDKRILKTLRTPLPLDHESWTLQSGKRVDLSERPEVTSYARLLERIRGVLEQLVSA